MGGLKWKKDDIKLLQEAIEDRKGVLLTVFTDYARDLGLFESSRLCDFVAFDGRALQAEQGSKDAEEWPRSIQAVVTSILSICM